MSPKFPRWLLHSTSKMVRWLFMCQGLTPFSCSVSSETLGPLLESQVHRHLAHQGSCGPTQQPRLAKRNLSSVLSLSISFLGSLSSQITASKTHLPGSIIKGSIHILCQAGLIIVGSLREGGTTSPLVVVGSPESGLEFKRTSRNHCFCFVLGFSLLNFSLCK